MTFTPARLRTLRILEVASAIGIAVMLFDAWYAARGGPVPVERWQIGVWALPWLVFFASFLALLHHSWFGGGRRPALLWVSRLFYWFLVACVAVVFVGIYAGFVFRRGG